MFVLLAHLVKWNVTQANVVGVCVCVCVCACVHTCLYCHVLAYLVKRNVIQAYVLHGGVSHLQDCMHVCVFIYVCVCVCRYMYVMYAYTVSRLTLHCTWYPECTVSSI